MRTFLLLILALTFAASSFGANQKYKNLFGDYRRAKFTENEGNSSDLGWDISLSTLLPVTSVVKSQEAVNGPLNGLNYSTFFNLETSLFLTLGYHWETFLQLGYYTYDTRKQSPAGGNALPIFHMFEMEVIPVLAGVRYRFGRSDIVPYVGLGGGMAYVRRKGFYDNAQVFNQQHLTEIVAEAKFGLEFFFSPRAGIRLEGSIHYLGVPEFTFNSGGTPAVTPVLLYSANPISMRYSSGLFLLL